MSESRFALATKIAPLIWIFAALFISTVQCDTCDDDKVLHFYWSAASGDVYYYDVYLFEDEGDDEDDCIRVRLYRTPTRENPFKVPVDAENGKKYRLKVRAVSNSGIEGPMSEPSDFVWCKLDPPCKSPGDVNGPTPGDANGDLTVDRRDLEILPTSWNTRRGDDSFNYRADINYDGLVNILDLIMMAVNWNIEYSDTATAPKRHSH